MTNDSLIEYTILEEDSIGKLEERLCRLAEAGWRVKGYGVRTSTIRDYYSACLERIMLQ